MAAIPLDLLLGGVGINESHTTEGTSMLDILNGLAYDLNRVKGSAPATITAPLSVTVPAHAVGSALADYATPASPTDAENIADRVRMNELRTAVISLHGYVAAMQTEIAALRATQTTRAGLTLLWSAQSTFSP